MRIKRSRGGVPDAYKWSRARGETLREVTRLAWPPVPGAKNDSAVALSTASPAAPMDPNSPSCPHQTPKDPGRVLPAPVGVHDRLSCWAGSDGH
jgi:hypothetical protein